MAHQIDESKPKYLSQTRFMSGRRIIKTSVTEITDENVVDVLRNMTYTLFETCVFCMGVLRLFHRMQLTELNPLYD